MDSIKNFFDSFKEFIWDIVGYLLPGSYLLILLSICANDRLFLSVKLSSLGNDFNSLIFVIASYLLGYVVYGFSFFKEKKLGDSSYMKIIESSISNKNSVVWSKKILKKKFKKKKIREDFSSASIRELRNIVMSFIPESDQKIYTFTFRSDISNNTANISLVLGLLGIISSLIYLLFDFKFFNVSLAYITLYICLIISYFLLKEIRDRFYAISMSVPFSIFTAKELNDGIQD